MSARTNRDHFCGGNPKVPGRFISGQELGLDPASLGSGKEISFILDLASILDT